MLFRSGADALFLDVRTPWEYLSSIPKAVIPGAMLGFLLPTVNQVSELLRGLEDGPFAEPEVLEILIRRWKTVPDRMRPDDRMVAHTGFLVFARYMEPPKATPKPELEPVAEPVVEPVVEPVAEESPNPTPEKDSSQDA